MVMSEFSKVITQIPNDPILPLTLALLALGVVGYLNRNRLRLSWLHIKARYYLNHLGIDQISELHCPDGLGNEFIIDRLLLRPEGITLLMTRQYPGRIYCADHIDDWTQIIGQKSYRFTNPLFELEHQVKAISDCIPGVAVNGYLFFDYLSEFPKGHPQRVIHPRQIPASLRTTKNSTIAPEVARAWRKLKSMART